MPLHAIPPTQPSPPVLTLLSLPGELRNLIYAYIAHASLPPVTIANQRILHKISFAPPPSDADKSNTALSNPTHKPLLTCFPGIAYANKQLYTELSPLFVQKMRFILHWNKDADYLDACLREITLLTGVPPTIERLVFQSHTFSLQHVRPRKNELSFIHKCAGLKELSITLHSASLLPFTRIPPAPQPGPQPNRRARHPPAVLPANIVVDIERAAGAWGLSTLQRLEKLERFRMECHIGAGEGYALHAFRQLAEWVGVHLEFAVVMDGRVRSGVKGVRKRVVEFSGRDGVVDFVVCGFVVERE